MSVSSRNDVDEILNLYRDHDSLAPALDETEVILVLDYFRDRDMAYRGGSRSGSEPIKFLVRHALIDTNIWPPELPVKGIVGPYILADPRDPYDPGGYYPDGIGIWLPPETRQA